MKHHPIVSSPHPPPPTHNPPTHPKFTQSSSKSSVKLNNKDRLRKISQHSFVEEIKLFEKRMDSRATVKAHPEEEEKLSCDGSFRNAKEKLLLLQSTV